MQDSEFRMHSPSAILVPALRSRGRMSISIAEKIAEVHLLELEARGAIRKVEGPCIETVYEFDDVVAKSLNAEGG